ncbi:hypothetical protein N7510_004132 [Penicillium lagena]|uniref:uncharacterized protein n=1 Tax=Penicillium lagena TaxID=94218 RepID=UPI00253FE113|nr:uncharacterized protein N7510_004132 [Penicillium lagena]KAJ5620148.1 hypothetical protein N7510_004132 [Penicillium lagena]
MTMSGKVKLELVQSLPTSGARAAEVFSIDGIQYLAIPQLAMDIPGGAIGINQGDSDISLLIYQVTRNGSFCLHQELPVPGGEDAEFFTIDGRHFLATASLRSGKGPYNMDVESTIFEWKGRVFEPFQRIPTFAAKQWRYFTVSGRHFLALAQGVTIPGLEPHVISDSTIFQWNGSTFTPFQTIPSKWGYNWLHFVLDGHNFLAYADHVQPSVILRWNGETFLHFQDLDGVGGRAFSFFTTTNGTAYLAFSRISSSSLVYRWNGQSFHLHQTLDGEGGREFALIKTKDNSYLMHVKFITGTPHDPNPVLDATVYKVCDVGLEAAATVPTLGATDVTVIPDTADEPRIVVTESITAKQSFRTDTHVYRFKNDSVKALVKEKAPYQCPEFLKLFTAYTASQTSIGAKLSATVTETTSSYPLLVATSFDMLLFPGNGQDPSFINFRLGNRGFKELAAISHLGPAMGSLVQIYQLSKGSAEWKVYAENLLQDTREVRKVNSETLWRDFIQCEAFQNREATIASMVEYACSLTERYLERALEDPTLLNAEFLRDQYLEARGNKLGATVPVNAFMIATFFLVGLDTSYRMRKWFSQHHLVWKKAMVLITGKQGRDTSGVTIGTSSVAQMILQSSDLGVPLERLYIAPHGPVPAINEVTTLESLREYERQFRLSWNALHGMAQLGETMFSGYPAYKPEPNSRPTIDSSTKFVSELPKIDSPDDWLSMITRMRLVLEDSRQLLSGCVTDYAAEQLRLANNDLSKVRVPGLDGVDYSLGLQSYVPSRGPTSFTIASCPYPLCTDLPAAIQTFDVHNGRLAYRIGGSPGAQPIVWIHGLPLDSRSWSAQYEHFVGKFYNVFIDLRGYGASSKLPKDACNVTQIYCDDLLALMDHLSLPKASIVGFASAGHVALRFAAQHPTRVTGLVTLNGSPRFKRNDTDYPVGFSDAHINDHFVAAGRLGGIKGLTDKVLDPAVVFQDLSTEDAAKVANWFREMSFKAGVNTVLCFFQDIANDDDRELMPLITAPTLLLSSSLGKEVPAQTALYLRQQIRDARLVEIPDADHFFHVTRPVVVNELIMGFLSTLSNTQH